MTLDVCGLPTPPLPRRDCLPDFPLPLPPFFSLPPRPRLPPLLLLLAVAVVVPFLSNACALLMLLPPPLPPSAVDDEAADAITQFC